MYVGNQAKCPCKGHHERQCVDVATALGTRHHDHRNAMLPRCESAFVCLAMSVFMSGTGCPRDVNRPGFGEPPMVPSASSARDEPVGNDDPRGAGRQPDYDGEARALRDAMLARLPDPLERKVERVCTTMLAAVSRFYRETESDTRHRGLALGRVAATHVDDLAACVATTSTEAAACVTVLLAEKNAEFPWLLDQCMRAFPRETSANGPHAKNSEFDARSPDRAMLDPIELTFVGDIILGRYRAKGFDPIALPDDEPFSDIAELLHADIVVGNLETPLMHDLPAESPIRAKFRFGGSRQSAKLLRDHFTVLDLANNHAHDLLRVGALATPELLRELGIRAVGASTEHEPAVRVETVVHGRWRVGFVAATTRRNVPQRADVPELPFCDTQELEMTIAPLVRAARNEHHLMIVLLHWGGEYADEPSPKQRSAARALVRAGADLVVGHHPHVLQGLEHYQHGVIAYSLGNFLFENLREPTRWTGILRVRTNPSLGCIDEVRFHPAFLARHPRPRPLPARKHVAERVRARLMQTSQPFRTRFRVDGDDLVLASAPCDGRR